MVGPPTYYRMFRLCHTELKPTCLAAFCIISLGEIPRNGINGSMTPSLYENALGNAHSPLLYLYCLPLNGWESAWTFMLPLLPQVLREIYRR